MQGCSPCRGDQGFRYFDGAADQSGEQVGDSEHDAVKIARSVEIVGWGAGPNLEASPIEY